MVLSLSIVAYSLVQSMVFPILPVLEAKLNTDAATGTWIMTTYFLSAAVATPIIGRLGDAYGKDRLLMVCLVALVIGSMAAAVAWSLPIMLVARVVQGIGGGAVPVCFGIVRDEFASERVPGAVGFMSSLLGVVSGLTLVVAGPVTAAIGYSWLFWFSAAYAVVVLILAVRYVPPSPVRRAGRVSWLGAVLLSAWLLALLVAISEAPSWGWASGSSIGLFVGAAVLVGLWLMTESRSPTPLIDLAMMRRPAVWSLNVVGLLYGIGLYTVPSLLPGLLQAPSSTGYGLGKSVSVAGVIVLPMSAAVFLAGLGVGRAAGRASSRSLLIVGIWISVPALVSLTVWHSDVLQIVLAEIVIGAGVGLCFSAMGALIVDAVPPDQTGVASGMNANIRTMGGALGLSVASSIFAAHTPHGATYPTETGYTVSLAAVAATTALAALATVLVPRPRRRPDAAVLTPLRWVGAAGRSVLGQVIRKPGRPS